MELIDECAMRFAEDKDFRLLVRGKLVFLFPVPISNTLWRSLTA